MTSLLAGIALVSLLVGGIGIMNIMLVSVTERTREIGLRMAIGAKPRNILVQFLVEAVMLSVHRRPARRRPPASAPRQYLVVALRLADAGAAGHRSSIAVVFSALVGIGFGLYPAYKASRLDPIQALRYE